MTISFVPGDVNEGRNSVVQGLWKDHHLIIYGSGNNLIIYSCTKTTNDDDINHLQTVYLKSDPVSVDFNIVNGLIAVALGSKVIVYKPLYEFMRKPQWTECLEFDNEDESSINVIKWAVSESELAIGSDKSLALSYIYEEFGEWHHRQRWHSEQGSPVTDLKITFSANRIVSQSGNFDCLIKVWSRNSYEDFNSSFELTYLNHPKGSYVTDFLWRYRNVGDDSNGEIDGSMANIKNIRGYIHNLEEDSDILYSLTNDFILRIWASFEYAGHSHIKVWASMDLKKSFPDGCIRNMFIIDNHCIDRQSVARFKNKAITSLGSRLDDVDLLFVVSPSNQVKVYAIVNLKTTPPNQIKFEEISTTNNFFGSGCLPQNSEGSLTKDPSVEYLLSKEFDVMNRPVIFPGISLLPNDVNESRIFFLVQDRIKKSMRFEALNYHKLLDNNDKFGCTELIRKFQGHSKSIRKLVRSHSCKDNILLSISNFPQYNYIWEPQEWNKNVGLTVAKKFKVNVASDEESSQGIWTAVLFNDVEKRDWLHRHHLAIVFDKSGNILLYDADGAKQVAEDEAELKFKLQVKGRDNSIMKSEPATVFSVVFEEEKFVIAVYHNNLSQAWLVTSDFELKPFAISDIPLDGGFHLISNNEMGSTDDEERRIAVIDKGGCVTLYALVTDGSRLSWQKRFTFQTDVSNASKIHGSASIHKFAVVDESGFKLSIWDTKLRFLEYEEAYPESLGPVRDLDWTFIDASELRSTTNAVLSVGFNRQVFLYTSLRYDYTNKIPSYSILKNIDVSDFTPHEIGDSIWLDNAHLVIGSGNQFFVDDRRFRLGYNQIIDSIIQQLLIGYVDTKSNDSSARMKATKDVTYDILNLVRLLNGPLPLYHPQFLIQCLFVGIVPLIEDVLLRLFKSIRKTSAIEWDLSIDLVGEIFGGQINPTPQTNGGGELEVFEKFNDGVADILTKMLTEVSLPLLTRHQQITLISLISIIKDRKKYANATDESGLRFLAGFKLFQNSAKQTQLTMRDINWALHSDNREFLLDSVNSYYRNRLRWTNFEECRLMYWLEGMRLSELLESCARNEFSEERDPSGLVSLFYSAIRKKQLLIGLWKTVSHPEKQKMLTFLSHNFNEPRWKSAALKNAFALLSKHRFLDAAYFFLLGDSLKDCCNTLAGRYKNIPLAITIAKVYEVSGGNNDGENKGLTTIIENYLVPEVLQSGDRWTTSWMFWELGHKEISIQALVKNPGDIFDANRHLFSDICQAHYFGELAHLGSKLHLYSNDDPLLAIMFRNLRRRAVKYLQGSLVISPAEEFDFLARVSLIYNRMGCDVLAVKLIRDWKFVKFDKDQNKVEWDTSKKESEEKDNSQTSFQQPPPQTAFEEPDMSAFDFGF